MKTLRIGIVGAGGIVRQRHLPGLARIEGVEVVAVANSRLESAQAFCAELAPQARPMERWQDIVALPELDVVWIGAHPDLHRPVTVAALEAGKHVFCQARMARDLAEAEAMHAAAAARPDLVTMLCPPPHGLNGDAYMRRVLAEGSLGALRHVRLRSLNGQFLDPTQPAHWRQRREISGLNILTLGIHTEVIQRWLGDFTVTAALGRIFTPQRHGYAMTIPDALEVLAEFPNGGPLGQFSFSGVHAGAPVEELLLTGEKGALLYDYAHDEIRHQLSGQPDWTPLPIPPDLARPWQVEADFINAVRHPEKPRPHPDFTDGLRYMRVVQRVSEVFDFGCLL